MSAHHWWDGSRCSSGRAALAERLRPRRFADVIGHAWARGYLANQAATRMGRSVLISGSSGNGLSCLGEIFACALLCQEGHGEPCLHCRDCSDAQQRSHFNWFSPAQDDFEDQAALVRHIRADVQAEAFGGGWKVVTIDQAHRLKEKSFEALHDVMERSPPKVTFILCTESVERVPRRVQSLFHLIRVSDATWGMRRTLVDRIAVEERLDLAENIRDLIAEVGGPDLKSLVRDVEMLVAGGPITTERVRAYYKIDGTHPIARYVEALLSGVDFATQHQLLASWETTPERMARELEAFFGQLFATDGLGLQGGRRPALLSPSQRSAIVAGLNARAAALGMPPRLFWRSIIRFWPERRLDSDEALLVRINEFDELLNGPGGASTMGAGDENGGGGRRRLSDVGSNERLVTTRGERKPPAAARKLDYLAFEEVQRIWNGGTHLVQVYGVPLNAMVELWHSPLNWSGKTAGPKLTKLLHELRPVVKRRAATPKCREPFHYLYVNEVFGSEGGMSRVVLSLPIDGTAAERIAQWIRDYLAYELGQNIPDEAFRFQFVPQKHLRDLSGHLSLLRSLCRGIDPNLRAGLAKNSASTPRPFLADVLGIQDRRAIGPWVNAYRCGASRLISAKARHAARDDDLSILSPLDAENWPAIEVGFEWAENAYRLEIEAVRMGLQDAIEADWPLSDDPLVMARRTVELKKLQDEWSKLRPVREAKRPGFG